MDDKTFQLIEKLYNRMESGFQEIRSEMATKGDIDRLEGRMTSLEGTVTHMEVNFGAKIDALYDGYKANTEAIQELRTDVQYLKTEVAKHEVKLRIVK